MKPPYAIGLIGYRIWLEFDEPVKNLGMTKDQAIKLAMDLMVHAHHLDAMEPK